MIEQYLCLLLVTLGYSLRAAGDTTPDDNQEDSFLPIAPTPAQATTAPVAPSVAISVTTPSQPTPDVSDAYQRGYKAGWEARDAREATSNRTMAQSSEQREFLRVAADSSNNFYRSCYEQYLSFGGLTERQWSASLASMAADKRAADMKRVAALNGVPQPEQARGAFIHAFGHKLSDWEEDVCDNSDEEE